MQLPYEMQIPSPYTPMASVVGARISAPLYLIWLVPSLRHVIAAAPLLVVVACGRDEGLKVRVT